MKMERLEFECQTKDNYVDCGVFLMRYMEVYKGGGQDKVDTDLVNECDAQLSQLYDLRRKYVTKILLSDYNLFKSSFIKSLEDYDKLTQHEKKKIYMAANLEKIKSRVDLVG